MLTFIPDESSARVEDAALPATSFMNLSGEAMEEMTTPSPDVDKRAQRMAMSPISDCKTSLGQLTINTSLTPDEKPTVMKGNVFA